MPTAITVTVRGHPVNGWFLRAFARPVIMIDGAEHDAHWSRPRTIPVSAGEHTVAVGVRYRGTPWLLGAESSALQVGIAAEETRGFVARNGPLNHQPFRLKEFSRTRPLRYR